MTDDNEPLSFGEFLKLTRLKKKISLTKAAKRMNMTPQKLSDIESGRRYHTRIALNIVTLAAKAYDIPIAEIIRNTATVVHNERTASELLSEAIPAARMTELLADQLLEKSKTYGPEIESLAVELHKHSGNVRTLLTAMRKRQNPSVESILDANEKDTSQP